MRPRLTWISATLCALLVLAAMIALTRHMLRLERDRRQAQSEAVFGEKMRLALWRMDTEAAATLIVENNRPTWHFRAISTPDQTWDSNLNLNGQDILQASPLLTETPGYANLHFEIDSRGPRSPQAPEGTAFNLAITQGLSAQEMAANRALYFNLLTVLRDHPPAGTKITPDRVISFTEASTGAYPAVTASLPPKASPAPEALSSNIAQQSYNSLEFSKRSEVLNRTTVQGKTGNGQGNYATEPPPTASGTKGTPKSAPRQSGQKKREFASQQSDAARNPGDPKDAERHVPSPLPIQENAPAAVEQSGSPAEDSAQPAAEAARVESSISAYKAVWLGPELFLLREVSDHRGARLQGVWLRHTELATTLTHSINDLLPDARLIPRRDTDTPGPLSLVSLPWTLDPGTIPATIAPRWSSIHTLLGGSWLLTIASLASAALLLRGVLTLSERRASFVSSVTHELRTPLTSFRLYADMLADGMVQDETKQRHYAGRLRDEADRLSHLVENVLSYSRIERGGGQARIEQVSASDLLARILPRLEDRCRADGIALHTIHGDGADSLPLQTDVTASGQILFNLIDNACKYAAGSPDGVKITLDQNSTHAIFRVQDSGPGIAKKERARLFEPFHKSASEAAHSKPGVGLGLALSRRLARALGGELKLVPSPAGTCFELFLPKRT